MLRWSKAFLFFSFFLIFISFVLSHIDVSSDLGTYEERRKGELGTDFYIPHQTEYDENEDPQMGTVFNKTKVVKVNRSSDKGDQLCPQYKNGEPMDLDKMADVWQTLYYQLPEKIVCFKIHVRRTTEKDQKANLQKYGNFGNSVDWSKCILEIRGSSIEDSNRKHFLLGDNSTGVFENLILSEVSSHNELDMLGKGHFQPTTITYHRTPDNPDQWRLVKDLLLMRDCDEGHIVVFSRFPRQHRHEDIYDALMLFGESAMEGKMACE